MKKILITLLVILLLCGICVGEAYLLKHFNVFDNNKPSNEQIVKPEQKPPVEKEVVKTIVETEEYGTFVLPKNYIKTVFACNNAMLPEGMNVSYLVDDVYDCLLHISEEEQPSDFDIDSAIICMKDDSQLYHILHFDEAINNGSYRPLTNNTVHYKDEHSAFDILFSPFELYLKANNYCFEITGMFQVYVRQLDFSIDNFDCSYPEIILSDTGVPLTALIYNRIMSDSATKITYEYEDITASDNSVVADVNADEPVEFPTEITDEYIASIGLPLANDKDREFFFNAVTVRNNIDGTSADFSNFRITAPTSDAMIRLYGIAVPHSNIFPHLQSAYEFESVVVKVNNKEKNPAWGLVPVYFIDYPIYPLESIVVTYNLKQVAESPLPTPPEKEGHTFVGWFLGRTCANDGTCEQWTNGSITSDIELHAHFEINKYIVTYLSHEGHKRGEEIVEWNTSAQTKSYSLGELENTFRFVGWFFEDGTQYTNQFIKADTTLTAKLERHSCCVELWSDEGYKISQRYVNLNEPITDLPKPSDTNDDYFVGWFFEDGTQYINQPVTTDIKLIQHWEYRFYNVAFNPDNGDKTTTLKVDKRYPIQNFPDVTKIGYNFVGWFFEDGTQYTNQLISSNTTLAARWEIKKYMVTFYVDDKIYATKEVEHGTSLTELFKNANEMNLIVSSVFMSNNIDISNPSKVFVTDDTIIEAEPMTGIEKDINIFKNNWRIIVGFIGGGILLILLIPAVFSVIKKRK